MADRLWMPFRGEKTAPFLESDKPYSESIKRYFSWVERLCEICSVNANQKHVYILDYLDDERAQVWECIWNRFPEPTAVDGETLDQRAERKYKAYKAKIFMDFRIETTTSTLGDCDDFVQKRLDSFLSRLGLPIVVSHQSISIPLATPLPISVETQAFRSNSDQLDASTVSIDANSVTTGSSTVDNDSCFSNGHLRPASNLLLQERLVTCHSEVLSSSPLVQFQRELPPHLSTSTPELQRQPLDRFEEESTVEISSWEDMSVESVTVIEEGDDGLRSAIVLDAKGRISSDFASLAATEPTPLATLDIQDAKSLPPQLDSVLSTTDAVSSRTDAVVIPKHQEYFARLRRRFHKPRLKGLHRFRIPIHDCALKKIYTIYPMERLREFMDDGRVLDEIGDVVQDD